MIDETQPWTEASQPSTEQPSTAPAGFCQDCGKPLTLDTARPVGSGVFCEPCLQIRLGAAATPAAAASPNATVPPTVPFNTGEPSPVIAGFLGFIPGVGAMYNGQYAKGVVHLVIFVVLMSIADNISDIFGIFVAGWVFYQVFEAAHTARARRDGTPLPNAFGFNDIGDRMGFGKNWPGSHARPVAPSVPSTPWAPGAAWTPGASWTPGAPPVPPADPTTPTNWGTTSPASPTPPANWAGYVPPTHFAPYATPPATTPAAAAYQNVYSTPGTPTPGTPAAATPVPPPAPASNFPVGAIVLIGLGVLFLVGTTIPNFHINASWFLTLLFASLGAYSLLKRTANSTSYGIRRFRAPIILFFASIICLLQAVNIRTFGQTWPLVLILFGVLALLDRAPFTQPDPTWNTAVATPPPSTSFVPASVSPTTTFEAGTESHTAEARADADSQESSR